MKNLIILLFLCITTASFGSDPDGKMYYDHRDSDSTQAKALKDRWKAVVDYIDPCLFEEYGDLPQGLRQQQLMEAMIKANNVALMSRLETCRSSKKTVDDAKAAREAQIASAMAAINHGKRVIALFLVRNSTKSLTTGQVKQLNATYSAIKDLLETGSLVSAKEEINALTPDGVLVTEGDKTELIAEIDSFLNP